MLLHLSRTIFICGTLLIWTIKWVLRPLEFAGPLQYFLNIAPNLFGAFLIPFAAFWFFSGKDHLVARIFRISCSFELKLVCLLGFCMLVVNEYLQKIPVFGRTFDYSDIVFSSLGLVVSCFVFGRLRSRQEPSPQLL
jgi:hypothetical protein